MKYLYKYNEKLTEVIDEEYLMLCFAEILDNYNNKSYKFSINSVPGWKIEIDGYKTKTNYRGTEVINNIIDFYENIKESIDKVKIEYNYDTEVEFLNGKIFISFIIKWSDYQLTNSYKKTHIQRK